MKIGLSILLTIFVTLASQAQSGTFTLKDFLGYVQKNHPVMVQADLLLEGAQQNVLKAKGGFDPVIGAGAQNKNFDEKNYYNLTGGEIKVPLPYGLSLQSGIENNTGDFLDPSESTPTNGLLHAGVTMSLGKGLLMNQRMADLQSAKAMYTMTEAKRQSLINDLLYSAVQKYWEWAEAHNDVAIYNEYVQVAKDRFEAKKINFLHGDAPAIDTLEAHINVETRELKLMNFKQRYQQLTFELSNYLWLEGQIPVVLTEDMEPPLLTGQDLPTLPLLDTLASIDDILGHPKLQALEGKKQMLLIDQKLKREYLKPTLDLKYNYLTKSFSDGLSPFTENYKYGVSFKMPILIRQGRGAYQMAGTKIKFNYSEIQETSLELANKLRALESNLQNASIQIENGLKIVSDYENLLKAERIKFNNGESSLFLLNTREKRLIEYRLTLVRYYKKYQVYHTGLSWAKGTIQQELAK